MRDRARIRGPDGPARGQRHIASAIGHAVTSRRRDAVAAPDFDSRAAVDRDDDCCAAPFRRSRRHDPSYPAAGAGPRRVVSVDLPREQCRTDLPLAMHQPRLQRCSHDAIALAVAGRRDSHASTRRPGQDQFCFGPSMFSSGPCQPRSLPPPTLPRMVSACVVRRLSLLVLSNVPSAHSSTLVRRGHLPAQR